MTLCAGVGRVAVKVDGPPEQRPAVGSDDVAGEKWEGL